MPRDAQGCPCMPSRYQLPRKYGMWVEATFLGAACPFLDSRTLAGWVISGYRQIGDLYFKNRQIGGFWVQKEPKWRLLNNLAIYSLNLAIFGHKDPCYISNWYLLPDWRFPYQKSPNWRNWRLPDRQIGATGGRQIAKLAKKKYVSKCSKWPNSSRNAIKIFSPIWRPGATVAITTYRQWVIWVSKWP